MMIYLLHFTLHTIWTDLLQLLWLEFHRLKEQSVNVKENPRIFKSLKQNQMLLKYNFLDRESTDNLYFLTLLHFHMMTRWWQEQKEEHETGPFAKMKTRKQMKYFEVTPGNSYTREEECMGFLDFLRAWSSSVQLSLG